MLLFQKKLRRKIQEETIIKEINQNVEYLKNELLPVVKKLIEDYTSNLLSIKQLPLILTNEDLKREFQISNSTLNRLINLSDFPDCWYGIRGHYAREDILEWYRNKNYDPFIKKMKSLRSL